MRSVHARFVLTCGIIAAVAVAYSAIAQNPDDINLGKVPRYAEDGTLKDLTLRRIADDDVQQFWFLNTFGTKKNQAFSNLHAWLKKERKKVVTWTYDPEERGFYLVTENLPAK